MPAKPEIEKLDQLSGTKYHLHAMRGWLEAVDAGFIDGSTLSISWNDKALVAKVDGEFAGILVWKHIEWTREVFIALGYILPKQRRKGVYTALFAALVEIGRKLGAATISGGISPRNEASVQSAISQGRTLRAVSYELEL